MGATLSVMFLRHAGDALLAGTRGYPNKHVRTARRIEGAAMRVAYLALCLAEQGGAFRWDAAGECVTFDPPDGMSIGSFVPEKDAKEKKKKQQQQQQQANADGEAEAASSSGSVPPQKDDKKHKHKQGNAGPAESSGQSANVTGEGQKNVTAGEENRGIVIDGEQQHKTTADSEAQQRETDVKATAGEQGPQRNAHVISAASHGQSESVAEAEAEAEAEADTSSSPAGDEVKHGKEKKGAIVIDVDEVDGSELVIGLRLRRKEDDKQQQQGGATDPPANAPSGNASHANANASHGNAASPPPTNAPPGNAPPANAPPANAPSGNAHSGNALNGNASSPGNAAAPAAEEAPLTASEQMVDYAKTIAHGRLSIEDLWTAKLIVAKKLKELHRDLARAEVAARRDRKRRYDEEDQGDHDGHLVPDEGETLGTLWDDALGFLGALVPTQSHATLVRAVEGAARLAVEWTLLLWDAHFQKSLNKMHLCPEQGKDKPEEDPTEEGAPRNRDRCPSADFWDQEIGPHGERLVLLADLVPHLARTVEGQGVRRASDLVVAEVHALVARLRRYENKQLKDADKQRPFSGHPEPSALKYMMCVTEVRLIDGAPHNKLLEVTVQDDGSTFEPDPDVARDKLRKLLEQDSVLRAAYRARSWPYLGGRAAARKMARDIVTACYAALRAPPPPPQQQAEEARSDDAASAAVARYRRAADNVRRARKDEALTDALKISVRDGGKPRASGGGS